MRSHNEQQYAYVFSMMVHRWKHKYDEWPQVKQELQRWLNAENFDCNGQQLTKLNGAQVNQRHVKITEEIKK